MENESTARAAAPLPFGVILAGGRSSRMGGGDKGLRLLAGRPLLAHVCERVAPQVAALAINANGDPARLGACGLPVLSDPVPGQPGPLAGILAGLDWAAACGADALLTVAADTPFVPHDLGARLAAAGPFALAASLDDDGSPHLHPTAGLWPVALRARLRADIATGAARVGRWAEEAGAARVLFRGRPDPFFNINTPEDLATAEALIRDG